LFLLAMSFTSSWYLSALIRVGAKNQSYVLVVWFIIFTHRIVSVNHTMSAYEMMWAAEAARNDPTGSPMTPQEFWRYIKGPELRIGGLTYPDIYPKGSTEREKAIREFSNQLLVLYTRFPTEYDQSKKKEYIDDYIYTYGGGNPKERRNVIAEAKAINRRADIFLAVQGTPVGEEKSERGLLPPNVAAEVAKYALGEKYPTFPKGGRTRKSKSMRRKRTLKRKGTRK
jgi:hypothetical protein